MIGKGSSNQLVRCPSKCYVQLRHTSHIICSPPPHTHTHTQELTVDKSRLDEVVDVARSLIRDKHTGSHIIRDHQESLNKKWEELNGLVEERKDLLKGAEQVHKFVRDASETNDRMNDKVVCAVCVCV